MYRGEVMRNYKVEFVKRTREILKTEFEHFKLKDREATFLLNCLLGLVVLISENEKLTKTAFKGRIDQDFLGLIPEKIGFAQQGIEPSVDLTETKISQFAISVGHKLELLTKDKLWFINKIRNGIAHQNIEAINQEKTWIGIRLWNEYQSKRDFEIIFTMEELKNFAISLADEYLSVHNPGEAQQNSL
jgi:HEPN pEK499 p136